MPTIEAESIVLRILDNKNINKNLQTLGLSKFIKNSNSNFEINSRIDFDFRTNRKWKTTTLYSILKELNSEEKNYYS